MGVATAALGYSPSNWLSVTPSGPQSITEIVYLHLALCDQIFSILQLDGPIIDNHRQFKLLPLCRAIIIMMNMRAPLTEDEHNVEPGESHWVYDLDPLAKSQMAFMALTGVSHGLCASMNIDDVGPGCQFPVGRSEATSSSSSRDVVRVSVEPPVKLFSDLLKRENDCLDTQEDHQTLDESLGPRVKSDPSFVISSADTYANQILKDADEKGIDNVSEARVALNRVRSGEISVETRWIQHGRLGTRSSHDDLKLVAPDQYVPPSK